MRVAILVHIFCVSVLLLLPCSATPKYHFAEDYFGEPLQPISFDRPISCTAIWKVDGGYNQRSLNPAETKQYVRIDVSKLDAPTLWKIDVHGLIADVTVGGGNYRTVETEVWNVASQTKDVLVLVHVEPGMDISTITVDAKYGTFVHCFSGRPLDANLATIYWGTCSNQ